MKLKTYIAILCGVLAVMVVSSLALINRELLFQPFVVGWEQELPLWSALVFVFLLGLLPPLVLVSIQTLQRQLETRRNRRLRREVESYDHRFRRAVDLAVDGRHGRAAEALESLLAERPEDFSALLLHGEQLRRIGRASDALAVHRRASVLYPASTAVLHELAADYEAAGEADVAREVRNRLLREFPGQGLAVLRRRRDAAMAASRWADAQRWHEKIGTLLSSSEGDAQDRDDDLEEGMRVGLAFERALALLEADTLHGERIREAAEIFRRLRDDEPRFIPAAIFYGETHLLLRDEKTALSAWRTGFVETGSPVFLQRLEDYFIEIGDPSRGIETLHALIQEADHDVLVRFYLGRLYARIEMHDDALRTLAAVEEAMDASPVFHYLLGRIHQRRDEPAKAAEHFQRGLALRGVPDMSYRCSHCRKRTADWEARCESCGKWNTVELDLGRELRDADLGVVDRPHWGGYVDPAVPELDDLDAEASGE